MAPVKVFGPAKSTAVARVLVCLEEVGAEYELVHIHIPAGEHKSPAHVARNPFGQVPAFEDGDLVLFGMLSNKPIKLSHTFFSTCITSTQCRTSKSSQYESRAISKYILRKHAFDLPRESNLSESTMVDVWLDVESQTFDTIMSAITFQCFIVPIFMGGATDHKIVKENMEKLENVLEVYEARLSKFKYLAGDFISLADLSHAPMVHYLLATPHASLLNRYPHVKLWISGLMDRPSVRKVTELMKAS